MNKVKEHLLGKIYSVVDVALIILAMACADRGYYIATSIALAAFLVSSGALSVALRLSESGAGEKSAQD